MGQRPSASGRRRPTARREPTSTARARTAVASPARDPSSILPAAGSASGRRATDARQAPARRAPPSRPPADAAKPTTCGIDRDIRRSRQRQTRARRAARARPRPRGSVRPRAPHPAAIAFNQEQPDQPRPAGAERGSDRRLALPTEPRAEQQVGHVRAGDQQQHADRAHSARAASGRTRPANDSSSGVTKTPISWFDEGYSRASDSAIVVISRCAPSTLLLTQARDRARTRDDWRDRAASALSCRIGNQTSTFIGSTPGGSTPTTVHVVIVHAHDAGEDRGSRPNGDATTHP